MIAMIAIALIEAPAAYRRVSPIALLIATNWDW